MNFTKNLKHNNIFNKHNPYLNDLATFSSQSKTQNVKPSTLMNQSSTKSTSLSQVIALKPQKSLLDNASRIQSWTLALYTSKTSLNLAQNDRDIELVPLDLPNQSVMKSDCIRTRGSSFNTSLRVNQEKILTFYCKRESITYKQGLHELAAPFMLFSENNLSLSEVYNLFALFIDKYLANFYGDEDFLALQCCLQALSFLLKYHDPGLYSFLTENYFTPEIFSTPWFLTLFASKLDLEMLYLLWDLYLVEQDPYFVVYLGVGLLLENKNIIMTSSPSVVPEVLTNLGIEDREQLKRLYRRAKNLKLSTPQSFPRKLEELEILQKVHSRDKGYKIRMKNNLEYLEHLESLILSPYELLQALYPADIGCFNPNCSSPSNEQFKDKADFTTIQKDASLTTEYSDGRSFSTQFLSPDKKNSFFSRMEHENLFLCNSCIVNSVPTNRFILEKSMPHLNEFFKEKEVYTVYDSTQTYYLNFIILDLRIHKEKGYLPKSHLIDVSNIVNDKVNQLVDEFAKLKGFCHFVLMTTKFDSRSLSQKEKDQSFLRQTGDSTSFDETILLMKFVSILTKKDFSWVSILEGGFTNIGAILEKKNIELMKFNSWTPKSYSKDYYENNTPKNFGLKINVFGERFGSMILNSKEVSRIHETSYESISASKSPMMKARTPTATNSSPGLASQNWQSVTPGIFQSDPRSKSAFKNGKEPKTMNFSHSQFSSPINFCEIGSPSIYSKTSTEDSPGKIKIKNLISTPVNKITDPSLGINQRTVSSPGAFYVLNISKDESIFKDDSLGASRDIFNSHKNKRKEFESTVLLNDSQSPFLVDEFYKHSRSETMSPLPKKSCNSRLNDYFAHRDDFEQKLLPMEPRSPISDFMSMARHQSTPSFVQSLGMGSNQKLNINKIERDHSFTKNACALKEEIQIIKNNEDLNYNQPKGDDQEISQRKNIKEIQKSQNLNNYVKIQENTENSGFERNSGPYIKLSEASSFKDSQINLDYKIHEKNALNTLIKVTPRKGGPLMSPGKNSMKKSDQMYDYKYADKSTTSKIKQTISTFQGTLTYDIVNRKNEENQNSEKSGRDKTKRKQSHSGFTPHYSSEDSLRPQLGFASPGEHKQNYLNLAQTSYQASHNVKQTPFKVIEPQKTADEKYFIQYFERRFFSIYICDHFQRLSQEKTDKIFDESFKIILLISHELVTAVQFNEKILHILKLLQKGVPANQIMRPAADTQSKDNWGKPGYQESTNSHLDLNLLSVFPLRLLLKVTSKKMEPKLISIYFKLPRIDQECFKRYHNLFPLSSVNMDLFRIAGNKEFDKILEEVRSFKDEKKFMEIKNIYRLESEEIAQDCIAKVQESYKKYPTAYY